MQIEQNEKDIKQAKNSSAQEKAGIEKLHKELAKLEKELAKCEVSIELRPLFLSKINS